MSTTFAAALAGCVTDEMTADDEAVDETEQSIHAPGVLGSTFQIQRAALLTNLGTRASRRCTATVIGPSHVLLAARCRPLVGETILFYTSTAANESSDREIVEVDFPPGVNPNSGDLTDSGGRFADLAVVRLEAPVPSTSIATTLAWRYPTGGDDEGVKVGAGQHQTTSTQSTLRQIADLTYSDNANNGHFLTESQQTNTFDEGGPFYFQSRQLGVLHGAVWEWANRDKYASVPHNLPWILGQNGYSWSGDPEIAFVQLTGTLSESFSTSSKQVCQYACDRSSSCVAWTHGSGLCRLFSSQTGGTASGLHTSALK